MTPEADFAVFLVTRDKRRVARERFKVRPSIMAVRNYENDTEKHLLLIRAQGKSEQKVS